jgi:hypothetical protein
MNAPNMALVAKTQTTALSVMSEQELMGVLRNSLYPGAKDESIKLVIGYCKAAGLDPMQKPVHIVPMSVSTGKKDDKGWDIKEMRDVVMPESVCTARRHRALGNVLALLSPNLATMKPERLVIPRSRFRSGAE